MQYVGGMEVRTKTAGFVAAYTDFLPSAEVERVEPNEQIPDVEFGMEALAGLAASGPDVLADALVASAGFTMKPGSRSG